MGFHICQHITHEEGEQLGLRNMDVFLSSGDVTLRFDSGRAWEMPDMAPLYVELGWVPPKEFIDDVMNHDLEEVDRRQTRTVRPSPAVPTKIGYLSPERDPLPEKRISDTLPKGFLEKFEEIMSSARDRVQTKGEIQQR